MLSPGDHMPHVAFRTIDDRIVSYADLWQQQNLIFVSLPMESAFTDYASDLDRALRPVLPADTSLVISHDALPDLPAPAILVADKWGEIHHTHAASQVMDLPDSDAVLEWLTYVRVQCPECQGETK